MQGLRVRRHQAQGRQLAICCVCLNLIYDPVFPPDVAVFRDGVRGDQQLDDDDRESWQVSFTSYLNLSKNN